MRLTRIKLNGLYNLKDVDLDLSSGSALIVGPNGSGKTNIINAVEWILEKHARTSGYRQKSTPINYKVVNDKSPRKYAEFHAGLNRREVRVVCKFRAIIVTLIVAQFVICIRHLYGHRQNDYRHADIFENMPKEAFDELLIWPAMTTEINHFGKKMVERCEAELYPKLLAIAEDSCDRNSTYRTSGAVWGIKYSQIDESWITYSSTANLKLPTDSEKEVTAISCFLEKFFGPASEKMFRFSNSKEAEEKEMTQSEVITSWIQPHAFMRRLLLPRFVFMTYKRAKWYDFAEDGDYIDIEILQNVTLFMRSENNAMGTLRSRDADLREILHSCRYASELVPTFLSNCIEKSLCILPQDRGLSERENVRWTISLKNAEQQLIKWKLSRNNETRRSRYVEVQKALKSMTGLEIDVVYLDDDGKQLMENKNPPLRLQLRKNKESDGFLVSESSGGEKECLMVLTATQLENADAVFLDEPGHSLHPPQQAQLRRWLETQRRPEQVFVIVSHAVEFVSPASLRSLYHMSDTGKGFTPFRLATSDNSSSEAVTKAHGEVEAMTTAGPSGQDIQESSKDEESNKVNLSQGAITMLMSPDMRKMFFATGVYFVEGETDKRFLSALRHYMLEHARIIIRAKSKNVRDLLQSQTIFEMDSWDILCLGGCANALKAYQAAKALKIPCAVVLDEDTITVKHGKRTEPITQANWEKSRLCRELKKNEKSVNAASTILREMQSAFNNPALFSTDGQKARAILEKHGFWVWRGDLEQLVLDNRDVRQGIKQIDVIVDFLDEELSCKLTFGERVHRSSDDSMKNFDEKIRDPLTLKLEELQNELEASRAARLEDPSSPVTVRLQGILNEISHYQQKAKQHDKYCQGTSKRSSESGAPRISLEGETSDARIQEEAFWKRVKEKLHDDGGWMKMPWEVMQQIIYLCLKDEKGHLAEFCKFMKRHQCQVRPEKNEVPEDIISKILTNARNPVEDKETQYNPDDMAV